MADITAIRAGLAANLSQISDLQVSAYMLANPTPPAAHVVPGPTDYDRAMGRGLDEIEMKVQVFVPLVVDIASQVNLDLYLNGSGTRSVKQAVETDRTLGGAAFDAWVSEATGPQLYRFADGASCLMCEWTVKIKAHG